MIGALHRRVRQVASRFAPSRAPGATAQGRCHRDSRRRGLRCALRHPHRRHRRSIDRPSGVDRGRRRRWTPRVDKAGLQIVRCDSGPGTSLVALNAGMS